MYQPPQTPPPLDLELYPRVSQVDTINTTLRKLFPACPAPWDDLQTGINFWKQVVSCVESIAEPLQAEYLLNDVREADKFLRMRMEQIGAGQTSRRNEADELFGVRPQK